MTPTLDQFAASGSRGRAPRGAVRLGCAVANRRFTRTLDDYLRFAVAWTPGRDGSAKHGGLRAVGPSQSAGRCGEPGLGAVGPSQSAGSVGGAWLRGSRPLPVSGIGRGSLA